ncbi:hypothetical protein RND81_02G150500 [Saponaria officinalis]|uniref:No apical meristem-associated C-terminal domain-containing protein n=1 Tax=Saponaria officinalis TaxID=3572 RepID=A0AAW1MQT4_SAPOF
MNLNSHVNPNFLENVSSQPNSNSQLDPNYNYNFTELISNNQDPRNTDIFGNPINLSQPPNQPTRRRVTSSSRKNPPTPTPPTNIQNNLSTGWRDKEDEALMSAWIQCSEDAVRDKNQTTVTRWDRVMSLYNQSQQENPTEIGIRSLDACKNRQKRLNLIVNKWVSCWKTIISRPRASGTTFQDDIEAAQDLFTEGDRNVKKISEFHVYNTVMSKHPKWSLQTCDFGITGDLSGGSSKRSRTEEPEDSTPDTPSRVNVGDSVCIRPGGRDAAKKQRKGKESEPSSTFSPENILSRLDDMKISKANLIQHGQSRIEADLTIEQIRAQSRREKMDKKLLQTLLAKENLDEEDLLMKRRLQQQYNF